MQSCCRLEIEEGQLLGMWGNFAASGLVPSQTNPGSKPIEKGGSTVKYISDALKCNWRCTDIFQK